MRLFSLNGTTHVSDAEHGEHVADEHGFFELPEALGQRLHAVYIGGQKVWETESEHVIRLAKAEQDRLRDPATLLATVAALAEKIDGKVTGKTGNKK